MQVKYAPSITKCKVNYLTRPYPVTVAQYRRFVEADSDGYLDARFWCIEAWEWRLKQRLTGPREWEEQLGHLNRPVTRVSWYEADAYCAWLSATRKQRVSLPTEAQWEYAARGIAARKYPWGDDDPADGHANFDGHIGHLTPVGIYPLGATPEGVQDLAGNVWEWCVGRYSAYDAEALKDSAGPPKRNSRVLRGGAFNGNAVRCRTAYRYCDTPEGDFDDVGFRCVVGLGSGGQRG